MGKGYTLRGGAGKSGQGGGSSNNDQAAEPLTSAPPADEETALRAGETSAEGAGGGEPPDDGGFPVCLNFTKIILASPFLLIGAVGAAFFWLVACILWPINWTCTLCYERQIGVCAALFRWLEKGARYPGKLLNWALT